MWEGRTGGEGESGSRQDEWKGRDGVACKCELQNAEREVAEERVHRLTVSEHKGRDRWDQRHTSNTTPVRRLANCRDGPVCGRRRRWVSYFFAMHCFSLSNSAPHSWCLLFPCVLATHIAYAVAWVRRREYVSFALLEGGVHLREGGSEREGDEAFERVSHVGWEGV